VIGIEFYLDSKGEETTCNDVRRKVLLEEFSLVRFSFIGLHCLDALQSARSRKMIGPDVST